MFAGKTVREKVLERPSGEGKIMESIFLPSLLHSLLPVSLHGQAANISFSGEHITQLILHLGQQLKVNLKYSCRRNVLKKNKIKAGINFIFQIQPNVKT